VEKRKFRVMEKEIIFFGVETLIWYKILLISIKLYANLYCMKRLITSCDRRLTA
jgi:hypothetical protein